MKHRMEMMGLYKHEGWMRQHYITQELTAQSVARLAGCSQSTIFNWLRRLGIPSRSYSEARLGDKNPMYGRRGENSPIRGRRPTTEELQKMSNANRGENHPNYGKTLSVDWCKKIGDAQRGSHRSDETRKKQSKNHADFSGENNPNWQGGMSFEPYCNKFNDAKKEEVREKHDRKCYLCGAPENGKRHSVHHTTYNKMEGCGADWHLVPLCPSCHAKTNFNRWYWFGLLYNRWAMNPEINFGVGDMRW